MPSYNDILDKYNSVVSRVGGIARSANDYLTKGKSLYDKAASYLGKTDNAPSTHAGIRDRYLRGFLDENSSAFPSVFSRLFDEPTYLTFRIEFDFSKPKDTVTSLGKVSYSTRHDYMPEPLLNIPEEPGIYDNDNTTLGQWRADGLTADGYSTANGYSTFTYLRSILGEVYRAQVLWTFVNGLKDIANNYPYYFQSIEGLGDLMKVNPQNGIRIKDDEGIIKIKCLEGLDLKITQLMQLYRKAAWDDVYQRWILPDMMRFFSMKIYISEIRLFHTMSSIHNTKKAVNMYDFSDANAQNLNRTIFDKSHASILGAIDNILDKASAISMDFLGTNSAVTRTIDALKTTTAAVGGVLELPYDNVKLCNNAINDIMPTICLECHQCEFMIDDTLPHTNSLAAFMDRKPVEPMISIKVGRLVDRQIYPLNRDLRKNDEGYVLPQYPNGNIAQGSYVDDEMLQKPNIQSFRYSDRWSTALKNDVRISNAGQRMGIYDARSLQYSEFNSDADNTAISLTYSLLRQFRPEDILSAATSIKEIKSAIDTGEYANMIKSTATSPEAQESLKYNLLADTLEHLSRSAATYINPADVNGTTSARALAQTSQALLAFMKDRDNYKAAYSTEYDSKATSYPEIEGTQYEDYTEIYNQQY